MSRLVSRGSAGEYQADEQEGVAQLPWRVSGRCRAAQLASIRQMSGQVSSGSAGEYQADEQEGVAQLTWRVSGMGRSPEGEHGNALQYSCLENPHGQRSLAGCSLWCRKE